MMSFENPKSFETSEISPLETFFRKMDEEEQRVIENDIFNSADSIPFENALSTITKVEEARMVMRLFREYIKDREFLSRELRFARAEEINEFIERRM